jgi:putative DNA primase/helicase
MEADRQAIRQFLERVHGPEPVGWLILWTRQDKATRAFSLGEDGALDQAVEYCAAKASTFDVYAAVGLQQERPANTSRGAEPGVSALPGLWADVDVAGAAHKAEALPPTEQDARSLIDTAGLEPSLVVHSGFGLQPYWLFREPYQIESDDERRRLKSLSTRFQLNLRLRANVRGWTMDSTADLCRVLRVPGTFNHKVDGDIRMVTAEYADCAYNPSDFEDLLAGIEDPGEESRETQPLLDLPPAKLPPILDGCVWMRHCRNDAAGLAEPEWYRMLTVVARCEDAERWAHDLSKAYPKYSRRETQRKLKQASGDKVAPVTCAYVQSDLNGGRFCGDCLFRGNVNSPIAIGRIEGVEAGPEPEPEEARTTGDDPPPAQPKPAEAAATKIEKFTDLGNARRFVARYRGSVLYCEAWSRWFLWDTMRWAEDERLEVFARAGDLIRSLYAVAKKIKDEDERKAFLSHLIKSESHRSIHAMVTLAKSDRAVARHPDDFDNDLWLCAVKNGTLDLRTGQLRSHDQKDMITKLAPVVYGPAAQCPNWLAFLDMIMLGRQSLVDFLKRALGSSLTGITSDKAMFILYGPGGDNGKSTMVEVMEMLLGNYARRTPVETFLKKREGSIPNDIARLRGARFVWAAENDRGVRLAESLIKEMTGGDRMAARFLHGEFFEFMPTFKIWFATNHKPTIRGDAAIWRRLKLVPFDYTIPKDRQKKRHEVMAMFQSELPGILNWAIEGCLEWQRDGLGVPDEVIDATREYESEQDTFSMFLEEKCVRVANARVLSLTLYREYKTWAEEHGETPASHKTFASLMSERGFAKTKTKVGALYSGIGLRTDDHYDSPKAAQSVPRQSRFDHDDDGEEV